MSCCGECGHEIAFERTNFHLPPWCPGCGADLKLVDRMPELRTPRRAEPVPTPINPEAIASQPAPAAPPRRPKLSSEPRAELSLPDGYLLTGAENESRAAIEGFRKEFWYYSAGAAVFGTLLVTLVYSSLEKLSSWKRVHGTVTEVHHRVSRKGFASETYTFSYTLGDKTFQAGRWYDMTLGTYKLGDRVTVVYSPTNPSESMVLCFSNLWAWPIVTSIPFAFCVLVVASSVVMRRYEERAARMQVS